MKKAWKKHKGKRTLPIEKQRLKIASNLSSETMQAREWSEIFKMLRGEKHEGEIRHVTMDKNWRICPYMNFYIVLYSKILSHYILNIIKV